MKWTRLGKRRHGRWEQDAREDVNRSLGGPSAKWRVGGKAGEAGIHEVTLYPKSVEKTVSRRMT